MNTETEIKLSDYLEYDWWHKWLGETFPEYHGSPDPSWVINRSSIMNVRDYVWYKSNVAVLGYMNLYRARPIFSVFIPETNYSFMRIFHMEEAERELQILEALAKPELLPLCISTWAGEIVTDYFKRH